MQICRNIECGEDFAEYGRMYKRANSDRIDYYCTSCGCKLKPIDFVSESEISTPFEGDKKGLRNMVDLAMGDSVSKAGNVLSPYDILEEHIEAGAIWNAEMLKTKKEHRVLVIPDVHAPFMHEKAISFLKDIYKKYNCNEVICLGDEIDYCRSSFHQSDPDALGATEELQRAAKQLGSLAEVFPTMKVCSGNHSQIPKRQAYAAGLSGSMIKENKAILLELGALVGGWEFADHFIVDGVKYTHGTGRQAKARMLQDGCSVVQGHFHSKTYLEYLANDYQLNFAMQLGALIDDDAYAFNYGKHYAKSHKNCGVVINGVPTIEYMEL